MRSAVHLSLVLCLVLSAVVWFTVSRVPPEIPLHYARPWGNFQLVPKSMLWLVAGLGVLSTAFHTTIAASVFKRDVFMAPVVVWSSVFFTVLLLLAVIVVYLRVGPA